MRLRLSRTAQKILEVLGDPDSGLELREEFKEELKGRLGKIPQGEFHIKR